MKKAQLAATLLLIIYAAVFLSGCTLAANGEQAYFYERPAIGFTAEDETVTKVEIEGQTSLRVEAQDGIVKITYWEEDYLQVIEKGKLKGPSAKKSLEEDLKSNKYKLERTTYDIKLKKEAEKDMKPFFRRTDDMELMVPEKVKSIKVSAKSGGIFLTGFEGLSTVDLTIEKGKINVDKCKMNRINATVTNGDLDITEISGAGVYECGRGSMELLGIAGDIELKSVSGDITIEKAEGKLKSDISEGSIAIKDSRLKPDSMIYASYGDIEVELEGIDTTGKYTIKASKGNIRLDMPEKTGWSLLAKSTLGKIVDKTGLLPEELKKSPDREVYGDVGGGGATIDVYVDMGDIYLFKGRR